MKQQPNRMTHTEKRVPCAGFPGLRLAKGGMRKLISWLGKKGLAGTSISSERITQQTEASKLDETFDTLNSQREGIATFGTSLEGRFLAIATALEELPGLSERLVRGSERLLDLAGGKDRGATILEDTLARLRGPMDYTRRYQDSSTANLAVLLESTQQIEKMLSYERIFRDATAPLKYLQTLFHVESAALGHDVQSNFASLTEDIERMQLQMTQILAEKFGKLQSNKQTAEALRSRLFEQGASQGKAIRDQEAELGQSVEKLKTLLASNKEKDNRVNATTQQISRKVGSLVFGLQAQDAVSQRLAHILEALDGIQSKFTEYQSQPSSDIKRNALRHLAQAAQAESAQLEAVQHDLGKVESELISTLLAIKTEVESLENVSVHLAPSQQVTAGLPGMVQMLLETLDAALVIARTTASSAEDAYQSIAPIRGQANNVTEVLRKLHGEIKLIALNAQVQTAGISQGTGLEVLAAQTATIAHETDKISNQIALGLDDLSQRLNALVTTFETIRDEGLQGTETWSRSCEEQKQILHHYRDESLAELRRMSETSLHIKRLTQSMADQVRPNASASESLQATRQTLQQLLECLPPLLDQDTSGSEEALKPMDYQRNCTMESEAAVQRIALGSSSRFDEEPQRAQPPGMSPESTSNITLFDDVPSMPSADTLPTGEPEGKVPARPADLAATPKTSQSAVLEKPLGDNIELF